MGAAPDPATYMIVVYKRRQVIPVAIYSAQRIGNSPEPCGSTLLKTGVELWSAYRAIDRLLKQGARSESYHDTHRMTIAFIYLNDYGTILCDGAECDDDACLKTARDVHVPQNNHPAPYR